MKKGVIFMDFWKTFGTIKATLLLAKLKACSFYVI